MIGQWDIATIFPRKFDNGFKLPKSVSIKVWTLGCKKN